MCWSLLTMLKAQRCRKRVSCNWFSFSFKAFKINHHQLTVTVCASWTFSLNFQDASALGIKKSLPTLMHSSKSVFLEFLTVKLTPYSRTVDHEMTNSHYCPSSQLPHKILEFFESIAASIVKLFVRFFYLDALQKVFSASDSVDLLHSLQEF